MTIPTFSEWHDPQPASPAEKKSWEIEEGTEAAPVRGLNSYHVLAELRLAQAQVTDLGNQVMRLRLAYQRLAAFNDLVLATTIMRADELTVFLYGKAFAAKTDAERLEIGG
jgi:hypothetical protein